MPMDSEAVEPAGPEPDIDSEDEVDAAVVLEEEDQLDAELAQQIEQLEMELSSKLDAMFGQTESYQRVGCINHAFHNVVGDGLKGAGQRVANTLARVKYWVPFCGNQASFLIVLIRLLRKK